MKINVLADWLDHNVIEFIESGVCACANSVNSIVRSDRKHFYTCCAKKDVI